MTTHRGGHPAAEGPLRPGAPPSQDAERAVDPSGGQGRRLHLRQAPLRPTRPTATPLRLPLDLSNCTSNVLVPKYKTILMPSCTFCRLSYVFVVLRGNAPSLRFYERVHSQPTHCYEARA